MEFKFFTANDVRELEIKSKLKNEICNITKKMQEAVKQGNYVAPLLHSHYSEEAFEEFRKAGFDVNKVSSEILISWKNATDKENNSKYAPWAYMFKVDTDNVVSDILQDIESGIRVCVDQQPGTGSWKRKGRLSNTVRKIIKDNGFKVTHYGRTENLEEFDLIEWPVG